jgi:hypothetical protein
MGKLAHVFCAHVSKELSHQLHDPELSLRKPILFKFDAGLEVASQQRVCNFVLNRKKLNCGLKILAR